MPHAALAPSLILLFAASPMMASDESAFRGLLTGFSFEADEILDTGPDNLAVFERGRGQVSLGSDFRTSGLSAVVLRDVPHDGDFPELQGFFEERREGRVWLHFDLLLTTTEHEMNIALAGPAGFGLGRDGISFWLTLRNGWLVHVSDGIPRRLVHARPFVWSTIDVVLDLDEATYDLVLREEDRAQPSAELHAQPTAARHQNAAIDKFSFIGDRGDDSSAVEYWIDDVVVASEDPVALPDFVAPGRRRTFVERLSAIVEAPTGTCPPILDRQDFAPERSEGDEVDSEVSERAWQEWLAGCSALARGDNQESLRRLTEAAHLVPESMPYASGRVLALMANLRIDEAETALIALADRFAADPRYPMVVASVAEANGDLDLAAEWLETSADPSERATTGGRWLDDLLRLTATYGLLLRRGEPEQAWHIADTLARREAALEQPDSSYQALWWERAGDAAFLAGANVDAEELYSYAIGTTNEAAEPTRHRLWLKLADVLWLKGDREGERELRETIYGRLD